jgi:hypothetical protein
MTLHRREPSRAAQAIAAVQFEAEAWRSLLDRSGDHVARAVNGFREVPVINVRLGGFGVVIMPYLGLAAVCDRAEPMERFALKQIVSFTLGC